MGISQRGDRPGPNEPSHSPSLLPPRALTFLLHIDRIWRCHFPLLSPQILPISRCSSPAPGLPEIWVYPQLTCRPLSQALSATWPSLDSGFGQAVLSLEAWAPDAASLLLWINGRLGLECVLGLPLVWTQPSTLQLPPSSCLPFSVSEISAHLCAVFLCPCLSAPCLLSLKMFSTQDLPNSLHGLF